MGRLLGLDFGSRTVGVAVSDGLGITAQELVTIERPKPGKLKKTLFAIGEICDEYGVDTIILGYPRNMDDTEGDRCKATMEFKELLEQKLKLPVVLHDERLTTVAAAEILDESGIKRSEQKRYIDQIAAAIILQEYMDNITPPPACGHLPQGGRL